jgi:hypothetical protein
MAPFIKLISRIGFVCSGPGTHRWSLPIGPRVEFAPLGYHLSEGRGRPPERSRTRRSARQALASHPPACGKAGLKMYDGADRWNVLRFTESWRARASPSAWPMRVAAGSPALFVGSRVSPHPPVVPSNGQAPDVGRRGPAAIGDWQNSLGTSIAARPVQDPSRPSRPT